MMTYSDILAAKCESTGMNETRKSTLQNPNLNSLGVECCISAEDLGRTCVATVDTNSVKSKDQDDKGVFYAPEAADHVEFERR